MHFCRALLSIQILATLSVLPWSAQALASRNEHRPVCSPDGSQMAYMLKSERTRDDWELYRLDIESQVHSRLTFHQGWDGYAVWSPDGSRIVYDREDQPGEPKRPWVMQMADLTTRPLGSYEGWLSISDWTPDNRLLGFYEKDGQRDLVMLDLEGNIIESITTTDHSSEHDAHFSPDGKLIAFASGDSDGNETSLEIIERASGERRVLRTSIGRIYGIDWSPDGREIAFVDAPEGDDDDADIFLYNIADESTRQITDDPAWDHMPEFCNSAHILLYTSYRSGEERIYRIDPDPQPFLTITRPAEP